MRISLLAILILTFSSCAVPRGRAAPEEFISRRDVSGVELVREAIALYRRKRLVEAELAFRQAEFLYPNAKNIKLNLAAVLSDIGSYDEARAVYNKLLKADPESLEILEGLAAVEIASGNFSEAVKKYDRLYQIVTKRKQFELASRYARNAAVASFRNGSIEEAVCYSSDALSLKPRPDELIRHVRLLMGLGMYQGALNAIATRVPGPQVEANPELLHQRALLHFALGEYEKTVESEIVALEFARVPNLSQSEMDYVRVLALRELGELEGDNEDEQEILNYTPLQEKIRLYWPGNLIERIVELKKGSNEA